MDKSEDSLASQRTQWVTLEQAAELVRSVAPGTLSLKDRKEDLAHLAADETLRCRDPRTGQVVVPRLVSSSYGRLPRLVQDVEIEVRSLRQYLLDRRASEKRWQSSVEDILNLGSEAVDPAKVLDSRLVAGASAGNAVVEHDKKAAPATTEPNKGGNPGKPFREEMAFFVGFRITELRSPDLQSVRCLILEIATTRGWELSGDSAHEWARKYMEWYKRRNRKT